MTPFPRSLFRARRLLLLAGLVLLAAGVTQCRMATDNVVRPQNDAAGASSCMTACSEAANSALRAESVLHVQNIKQCGDDPACKAQEDARHEAAVVAIQNQRKACQSGCHQQGGGRGGR